VERRKLERIGRPGGIAFEPGKCILCGLCIQAATRGGEPLGLAFAGRGFDVNVAVPFGRSLDEALTRTASECVNVCPTGALSSSL
jgi:NADH dehydrogenase/NADH:ubiquinone oxidoreductase subunit G